MRGFIGASTVPLTYAYFLLESKSAQSYTLALSTIKTAAPLFNPPNFMVDFETSEHRAIRSVYPHSTIHGCLFHWKKAIIRHLEATWLYSAKYPRTMWNMYRAVKMLTPEPTMCLRVAITRSTLLLVAPTHASVFFYWNPPEVQCWAGDQIYPIWFWNGPSSEEKELTHPRQRWENQ